MLYSETEVEGMIALEVAKAKKVIKNKFAIFYIATILVAGVVLICAVLVGDKVIDFQERQINGLSSNSVSQVEAPKDVPKPNP